MPTQVTSAVFISYSRKDLKRVHPLARFLRASGVKVFIDVDNIDYGEEWRKILEENMDASVRMLVFWSKHSRKSKEVRWEFTRAMTVPGITVVPVQLDKTKLPPELVKYRSMPELLPLMNRVAKLGSPVSMVYRFGLAPLSFVLLLGMSGMAIRDRMSTHTTTSTISPQPLNLVSPATFTFTPTPTPRPIINLPRKKRTIFPSLIPEQQGPSLNIDHIDSIFEGPVGFTGSIIDSDRPYNINAASKIIEYPAVYVFEHRPDNSPIIWAILIVALICVLTPLSIWTIRWQRLVKSLRATLFQDTPTRS